MGCAPQRFYNYHPGSNAVLFFVAVICGVIVYGLIDIALLNDSALEVRKTAIQYKEKHSIHAPGPWVPQRKWVKFPDRMWHGYQLPVLTARPLGRMGNIMGEYATLWALKHIYNATVLVMPGMKKKLSCFPSLSLPDCPDGCNTTGWKRMGRTGGISHYNFTKIENAAAGLSGPGTFVLTNCLFEIHLFNFFKEDLRREFTFAEEIQRKVRESLANVQQEWQSINNSTVLPVLVGFHVRRTDYAKHAFRIFGGKLPGTIYFTRALNYYRRKFSNDVAFVVASDDMAFVRMKLGNHSDVYFSAGASPFEDMALLSSCNHSIVTLGSFGFWTGYLAGGEVVYPDVRTQRRYRFSREMYEITGITNFTPIFPD
ncbi:galactoside alpha-(1,2)-fucosyltransferase 2-like [Penaeus monodon]|uniref:galactoside alpha-(1,2)-fucosyltransferase 2-like n=1 Tax=Penaeus monodon TaxID=6687 RepID=UPI0018A6E925|nr:galactoside alpha-(1,2)-fucosyltransferase 2-like [Penaeus monodon]